MIRKTNNKFKRGQVALVLILLAAAALIFLSITLNWGRIAQVKSMLTIAADQAVATLASDVASYGEMNKQTYLQNTNSLSELGGILMAILMVVVAIIVLIITILTWGATSYLFVLVVAIIAVVVAVVNLVLQIVVVQPGITSMWNKLQQQQPIVQQFEEGGIGAALQGSVSDQVNITDYFDWNGNGIFGTNATSKDTVSRFAIYYTDRLKMFNQQNPPDPKVVFFYNELGEFINGETCNQNAIEASTYPTVYSLNPVCPTDCYNATTKVSSSSTACQEKIPGSFQLSDACPANSDNTNTAIYNPYCDPCCQPLNIPNPYYHPPAGTPVPPKNPAQPLFINIRPDSCPSDAECSTNNPYPNAPDIYDPSYQNYADQVSFLAQLGRDQQLIPTTGSPVLPLAAMTPNGSANNGMFFPNGVYPFFWEMNYFSPQVDNLDPVSSKLTAAQMHWCSPHAPQAVSYTAPSGFTDLIQLDTTKAFSLPYTCSGQDCCVNYLPDAVSSVGQISTGTLNITVGSSTITPSVSITSVVGNNEKNYNGGYAFQLPAAFPITITATATDTNTVTGVSSGASFSTGIFYSQANANPDATVSPVPSTGIFSETFSGGQSITDLQQQIYATATDSFGNTATSSTVAIYFANAPTVSITSPTGGNVASGSPISVAVTAAETSGTISSVTANGTPCTGLGPTYTCSLPAQTLPTGVTQMPYTITARATDMYGYTVTSTTVTVTIT